MHPADIQAELKKRGLRQKDIARRQGVAASNVSAIIHKKKISDPIMRAVATAIGRDPGEVFPEHYRDKPKRFAPKVINI